MPHLSNAVSLFVPTQPSTQKKVNGINYSLIKPTVLLQKYIYSYWEFYTDQPLTQPYHHRVVADGCMAVIIDALNPENSFIRGFVPSYTEYAFTGSFHYIGVCFYPSAFPLLFNCPANDLTNRFEPLYLHMPLMAKSFTALFEHKKTLCQIKEVFDTYFLRSLASHPPSFDARFFNALDIIIKSKGILSTQLGLDTGISPRHLRRLFDFYIGESPKAFCRIVRFQNLINSNPCRVGIRTHKVFYDAGYYDQAHFIKDFKELYGLTPSRAFQHIEVTKDSHPQVNGK